MSATQMYPNLWVLGSTYTKTGKVITPAITGLFSLPAEFLINISFG